MSISYIPYQYVLPYCLYVLHKHVYVVWRSSPVYAQVGNFQQRRPKSTAFYLPIRRKPRHPDDPTSGVTVLDECIFRVFFSIRCLVAGTLIGFNGSQTSHWHVIRFWHCFHCDGSTRRWNRGTMTDLLTFDSRTAGLALTGTPLCLARRPIRRPTHGWWRSVDKFAAGRDAQVN
jgi:hypothetical protein